VLGLMAAAVLDGSRGGGTQAPVSGSGPGLRSRVPVAWAAGGNRTQIDAEKCRLCRFLSVNPRRSVFGRFLSTICIPRRIVLWRLLDPIFMLPLGTSAVTLGLGYIVALDEPPLNLRTSPLLVVLAHTLVALPFVVRSVLPALRSIHPHLREAAAVLGASPWRVWREVDLPIVARAVLVGAVFAFTISMGEFGATSLIARPERPTMPVAIYRFLARPGTANYGQALAMSTLLMLVCTLGFLAIERFRVGEVGEF